MFVYKTMKKMFYSLRFSTCFLQYFYPAIKIDSWGKRWFNQSLLSNSPSGIFNYPWLGVFTRICFQIALPIDSKFYPSISKSKNTIWSLFWHNRSKEFWKRNPLRKETFDFGFRKKQNNTITVKYLLAQCIFTGRLFCPKFNRARFIRKTNMFCENNKILGCILF